MHHTHWVTVKHLGLRAIHGLESCASRFIHEHVYVEMSNPFSWHFGLVSSVFITLSFRKMYMVKERRKMGAKLTEQKIGEIDKYTYMYMNSICTCKCIQTHRGIWGHAYQRAANFFKGGGANIPPVPVKRNPARVNKLQFPFVPLWRGRRPEGDWQPLLWLKIGTPHP